MMMIFFFFFRFFVKGDNIVLQTRKIFLVIHACRCIHSRLSEILNVLLVCFDNIKKKTEKMIKSLMDILVDSQPFNIT